MKQTILNRTAVRGFILETVLRDRGGFLDRVAEMSIDILDAWLRVKIEREVLRHPTRGKTFRLDHRHLNGSPRLADARFRAFAEGVANLTAELDVDSLDVEEMRTTLQTIVARSVGLQRQQEIKK